MQLIQVCNGASEVLLLIGHIASVIENVSSENQVKMHSSDNLITIQINDEVVAQADLNSNHWHVSVDMRFIEYI